MDYFLLYEKQKPEDFTYSINQIGSITSTKNFYPEQGFYFLKKMIELNEMKILNKIHIVSRDKKQKYNIEEFLDFLKKKKIKIMKQ